MTHERFHRVALEFEVEVVDPVTLRATFLPDSLNVNGQVVQGVGDTPDEALVGMALARPLMLLLQSLEESTGLRMGDKMTGPLVRPRDDDGNHQAMRWSKQSGRNNDGELIDPSLEPGSIEYLWE